MTPEELLFMGLITQADYRQVQAARIAEAQAQIKKAEEETKKATEYRIAEEERLRIDSGTEGPRSDW